MVHIYSALFPTSDHSKSFTTLPHIHSFTHRRRCRPQKAAISSYGVGRVRFLPQEDLDTQLGGAGDRTSNLPVTSQPALPPEPRASLITGRTCRQYKRIQRMKRGRRKRHEMMCSHSRHCGVQIFFYLFALLRDRICNRMLCYTSP